MLSFQQLIQNLTDTTQPSRSRREAASTLASRGDTQAVPFLIEALTDSDSILRREAAKALQQLNAASATEPLLHALEIEPNDLTAWAIIEAVGELGNPRVLPMLKSFQSADSLLTQMEVKKSIARIETRYPELDNLAPTLGEAGAGEEIDVGEFDLPAARGIDGMHSSSAMNAAEASDAASLEQHDTGKGQAQGAAPTPNLEVEDRKASISVEATGISTSFAGENTLWGPDATEPEEIAVEEHPVQPATELEGQAQGTAPTTELEGQAQGTAPTTELEGQAQGTAPTTETESPDSEFTPDEQEEAAELKDLSEPIAQSSRRGRHRTTLPVLVPSSSAVRCAPMEFGRLPERPRRNFFATLLHPSQYFSKRWLSRARAYIVLWCVLLAATIGFVRYHGQNESEATSLARLGFSIADVPEQVKRSLDESDFYIQEGYYRQAISSYRLIQSLAAIPVHFYKKLGFAYFKEGQYALAVEAYELFLAAQANTTSDPFVAEAAFTGSYQPGWIGKTAGLDYEAYNALGTAYMKLRRMKDAQRAYEQAIVIAPEDGQAYNNLARLYADAGGIFPFKAGGDTFRQQRLKFSEVLAYTAVALNPEVAPYQATLGRILARRGQLNKAIKSLERAIRLQDDYIEAHYHLARVALKAEERDKALKAIQNVLKLNPAFVLVNSQM